MLPQKHILVADEDAPLRFAVGRTLRQAGYRVSEAPDGRQAHLMVLAANQQEKPFDLLLLDCQMPFICGGQLLRTLAQLTCCPPLLLMSSLLTTQLLPVADGHCRGVLAKPINSEALLHAVAQALAGV